MTRRRLELVRRLTSVAVVWSVLTCCSAGCAVAPLPRPAPPPAGELQLPELAPVHQALRDACGEVQADGTVACSAEKLLAVDHAAVELYHDGRRAVAVARAERRHRQIDGEAYEVALDERDQVIESMRWEFWRGFGLGVGAGLGTAGGALGGWEIGRRLE